MKSDKKEADRGMTSTGSQKSTELPNARSQTSYRIESLDRWCTLHRALSEWLKLQVTHSKTARHISTETLRSASRLLISIGRGEAQAPTDRIRRSRFFRELPDRRSGFASLAIPCVRKTPAGAGFPTQGRSSSVLVGGVIR